MLMRTLQNPLPKFKMKMESYSQVNLSQLIFPSPLINWKLGIAMATFPLKDSFTQYHQDHTSLILTLEVLPATQIFRVDLFKDFLTIIQIIYNPMIGFTAEDLIQRNSKVKEIRAKAKIY